ncbi:hypothetical protein SASPL_114278 [Salvia splendens]|uniref:Pectate lyase n=1 Tax=Salvia splendens TaxID=180675 RepID=A0A8X8Y5P0_SALSN|nr:hypothetical protein SASPL_114278 [Salvia splendens]
MSIILLLGCLAHASTFSARPVMHDASEAARWTGNPIDDCWWCDPNWETNRKVLADCGIGFGRNAIGGRDGEFYLVTTKDDDAQYPTQGMLRPSVIQSEPLCIIFQRDMSITLKEELMMKSYKTIEGRGFNVEIANGLCITIQGVTNIIVRDIYIHDCVQAGNAVVTDVPQHYKLRGISDGDGISIFGARDVWIDHCTLSHCHDGLIDVVSGSTAIRVSNNCMFEHSEVMLMGYSDDYVVDKNMQVTIAFNYFGQRLVQRMPRLLSK